MFSDGMSWHESRDFAAHRFGRAAPLFRLTGRAFARIIS